MKKNTTHQYVKVPKNYVVIDMDIPDGNRSGTHIYRSGRTRTIRVNNAIAPAAPASVWGYKGCAGKGGKTTNAAIPTSDK